MYGRNTETMQVEFHDFLILWGVKCITIVILHESKFALYHKGMKAGLALNVAEKEAKLGGLLSPRDVQTWWT